MLDISESSLGKWGAGARRPAFETALRVSDFFGVPANRLAQAEFEDLLENELADAKRFQAVEAKIRHARTGLKAVEHLEEGETVDVVTGEPVDRKRRR